MSNQDKFQPVLGGPTNMGATVAEERQGNSPLAFLNSALKLGANVMSDVTTTTKEENKYLKEAAENQMMNDYATEMSKLKSAYDQKKMSLEDLDIATRKVTDKYYQQNLISAKDLHSIRDGAIGTDVSGKRLDTDLGIEKAQKERVITQRNTIIDNAKKNNPAWALLSDEQVMSNINKVEILSRNLVGAIDTLNQTYQADDKANIEYAKEGVVKAATDVEVENVFRGIMNGIQLVGPEAVFNPEALAQNKQYLYRRLTQDVVPPVEAGLARAAVDRVMEVTGYSDAVELVKQGVIDAKEFKTNLNLLAQETLKQNMYVTAPTMVVLGNLSPEAEALVLGDNGLLEALQNEVKTLVKGGPVNTTGNVTATQFYGTVLQGTVNGDLANTPVRRLTTMIQGSINETSLPDNVKDLSDDNVKKVEKNAEASARNLFDPGVQRKYSKEGSPEDMQTLENGQKKTIKTLAQIYKHSIDNSQWVGNIRYEESTGSVVLIGDQGGTGLFKSLSAPYSANIVEKMNQTLDWIRGSLAFNERQKKQYVKDCLEYWGITELAEGESRTGLGGLTVNQIGEQVIDTGVETIKIAKGEKSNVIEEGGKALYDLVNNKEERDALVDSLPVSTDVKEYLKTALDYGSKAFKVTAEAPVEIIKKVNIEDVTEPFTAPAETVTEGILNILDPSYTGTVEESIQTVWDNIPEDIQKDVKAFFSSLTSTDTPLVKEIKKIALNPIVEFGKEIIKNPVQSSEEWSYKYGKEGVVTKAYKQAWEDVKEGIKVITDWLTDTSEDESEIVEGMALRKLNRQQDKRAKKLIEDLKKRNKKGA